MTSVLFVCLGNICRSPTAQGVFERLVAEHGLSYAIEVDSAGTAGWNVGAAPDPRSIRAAGRRGIDISHQRARQITRRDLEHFDHVLTMDRDNLRAVRQLAGGNHNCHIGLLLDFAPHLGLSDVPDPYYGESQDFENVLDLIEAAASGLLAQIRAEFPQ